MSPASALNALLLGTAVGLLHTRVRTAWSRCSASLPAAIGFVSVAGYLYGAAPLYPLGSFVSVACTQRVVLDPARRNPSCHA